MESSNFKEFTAADIRVTFLWSEKILRFSSFKNIVRLTLGEVGKGSGGAKTVFVL
jgi:hypothetical protein